MRKLLRSARLAIVGVILALSAPLPASADTGNFTFDSFHADYTLSRLEDGTAHLEVVETIVARFPDFDQNRGIVRAIPADYDGVDLKTIVTSVKDQDGSDVPFEESSSDGFVQLALGTDDFVRGVMTYVVTYSQDNVVRSFADTSADEFYWDVNGVGWDQPFGTVSSSVHLEDVVAEAYTGSAACYVGAQGDNNACPITNLGFGDVDPGSPGLAPSTLTFMASADNLEPGQTMSVAIGFEPGTFVIPEPTIAVPQPVPAGFDVGAGIVGLLSCGAVAAAIVSRVRAGRGASGRGIIIPQYSEPEGITIMQSAHLLGRANTTIPAAIVRLAVRKNIRILAYAVEKDGEPYTLQYLGSPRANAEDLRLLAALFGATPEAGQLRQFGPGETALMAELTSMSAAAKSSLRPSGLLEKQSRRPVAVGAVVVQLILGAIAVVMLMVSGVLYLNVSLLLAPIMMFGAVALIVCIVLSIRRLLPTRTGAEAREYLEGMRMYLTLAEKDRLRALQSPGGAERVDVGSNLEMIRLYEKLLPWAVVWGVEDQWMRELEVRVRALPEQPDWFVGDNGFNAVVFASTMRGFSTAMTPPATSSSWSGSGGGSFSGGSFGGGFSGGGGGGGGGGGR